MACFLSVATTLNFDRLSSLWLRNVTTYVQANPKARQNPRGLSQLDGYKRGLVNSLTGNLQKFGLDRVAKVETLEEIFSEADETSENLTQDCPETTNQTEQKS